MLGSSSWGKLSNANTETICIAMREAASSSVLQQEQHKIIPCAMFWKWAALRNGCACSWLLPLRTPQSSLPLIYQATVSVLGV